MANTKGRQAGNWFHTQISLELLSVEGQFYYLNTNLKHVDLIILKQ